MEAEIDTDKFLEDMMKLIRLKVIAADPLKGLAGHKDELESRSEEVMTIIANAIHKDGESSIASTLNNMEIATGALQIYVRCHAPN